MNSSNYDIDVYYYRLREGSALHEAVTAYQQACEDFCEKAEAIVKKYGADSAVRLNHVFNMQVVALNFEESKSPLFGWHRNTSGSYEPEHYSEADEDFVGLQLDYFHAFYKPLIEGTRFAQLGDEIIVACTPNKDGTPPQLEGAELIGDEEFAAIRDAAPQEDRNTERLSRHNWTPQEILKSPVFTASESVQDSKQAYAARWPTAASIKDEIRDSLPGRALRWIGRQFAAPAAHA